MSRNMIDGYLCAANSFLEGKRIAVDGELDDRGRSSLRILHDDGSKSRLGALSSGEREIVTLLFAAAVPDSHEVLLIDEPETSLT